MKRPGSDKKPNDRYSVIKTYTVTGMKNLASDEFVEIIYGASDDLYYRCADSESFKPSVWNLRPFEPFFKRYFVDDKGKKHYSVEFQTIGNGDPYSKVAVIIAQATVYDLENKVRETAKNYMFIGNPIEDSYEAALQYWTEF
jgi:hypothetical protein